MNTITVQIVDLKPDPDNARTHDEKNIASIVGSLKEFGQQKPIVIDKKNRIVAGNGTVLAAAELGWTEIDAVRTKLTGNKAKAFALADNRTAELADWDRDILKVQLGELVKVDMDIQALGFNLDEVGEEGGGGDSGLTDPDEVPEVPQNVFGVERGDIWQLGDHRVMCGDSTDKGDVDRLMDGAKADMVFTDPPYGINLDTDYTSMGDKAQTHRRVHGDDKPFDASPFKDMAPEQFWFGANYYIESFGRAYGEGSWFVWDKYPTDQNDKRFGSLFELVWSKAKHKQIINRIPSLNVGHQKREDIIHPTQKPSDLVTWFLEKYSKTGQVIIDLFLGSGSTLIACQNTNRKCYGLEIDPHYCSVIIKRWQDFTGQEAKRIAKS
jgi:DNA modification methylase